MNIIYHFTVCFYFYSFRKKIIVQEIWQFFAVLLLQKKYTNNNLKNYFAQKKLVFVKQWSPPQKSIRFGFIRLVDHIYCTFFLRNTSGVRSGPGCNLYRTWRTKSWKKKARKNNWTYQMTKSCTLKLQNFLQVIWLQLEAFVSDIMQKLQKLTFIS